MQRAAVDIETPDGVADAYLVRPDDDGGTRPPGVLLLMDAFGLRPRIEEMADRIAAGGYAVLAPNLFYRGGRAPVVPFPDMSEPGARETFMAGIRPLMAQLNRETLAADGAAYLDALAQVADGPFAVAGYCMGARSAWWIAATNPDRVAALGGFHGGGFVTEGPDSPHRAAGDLRAVAYFGHAEQDPNNTPEQMAALEAALDAAGVEHRTEVYDALHGYTMADTPVYDEQATERHFAALSDLLGRTLAR